MIIIINILVWIIQISEVQISACLLIQLFIGLGREYESLFLRRNLNVSQKIFLEINFISKFHTNFLNLAKSSEAIVELSKIPYQHVFSYKFEVKYNFFVTVGVEQLVTKVHTPLESFTARAVSMML